MPFETTPEQQAKLDLIANKMYWSGIDEEFISTAVALALRDQGVFDLFELWNRSSFWDKVGILDDIHDSIDDYSQDEDEAGGQ